MSKYSKYDSYIFSLFKEGKSLGQISYRIAKKEGKKHASGSIREYVSRVINSNNQIAKELTDRGIDKDSWDIAWIKTKEGSYRIKKEYIDFENNKESFLQDIQKYAPSFDTVKRTSGRKEEILVIDLADPHFGKLSKKEETGEDYNVEITRIGLERGVKILLDKASKAADLEKVIVIIGNDALHFDGSDFNTTNGTKQDPSSLWWEVYNIAFKSYIDILLMCKEVADVHVIYCPSNHDYHLGFGLAHGLSSYFSKDSQITFDVSPQHRKYLLYGVNLLGFSHGDYIKPNQVPDLMKTEAKKAWAMAKFGYYYLHHIHHKDRQSVKSGKSLLLEKDYSDVTVISNKGTINPEDRVYVEYIRSISAADSWHYKSGYVGNIRAVEAFIHHYKYGQTDRLTSIFEIDDTK
jgi:hypothetical protein